MQIVSDDFLSSINKALDSMVQIAETLGDDKVNQTPDFPGANSPYVILSHCIGLTHYWIGSVLGGRPINRDRDAEFRARGTVADIRQQVRNLQQQLPTDIQKVEGEQTVAFPMELRHEHLKDSRQGAILIHTYEELVQHLGHLDITRDLLLHR